MLEANVLKLEEETVQTLGLSMTKLYDEDNQHTNIRTKLDQLKKTHDNKKRTPHYR